MTQCQDTTDWGVVPNFRYWDTKKFILDHLTNSKCYLNGCRPTEKGKCEGLKLENRG